MCVCAWGGVVGVKGHIHSDYPQGVFNPRHLRVKHFIASKKLC